MNMIKTISNLFSIRNTLLLISVFTVFLAVATYIEQRYGTQTANALVYKAKWFEFMQLLFAIALIVNIINYTILKSQKPVVFIFHLSFLIILIGGAVTRYLGFEGFLYLNEGERSDRVITSSTYLTLEVNGENGYKTFEKEVFFSKIGSNYLKEYISYGKDNIKIEVLKYIPNVVVKERLDGSTFYNPLEKKSETDALFIIVSYKEESKKVAIYGKSGVPGEKFWVELDNIKIALSYGSKIVEIPFFIKLLSFNISYYPGTTKPYYIGSKILIVDKDDKSRISYNLSLNRVLDYKGYRLLQSYYVVDKSGSFLKINKDPGRLVVFFGYTLFAISIFIALLMYNGRFQLVLRKLEFFLKKGANNAILIVACFIMVAASTSLYADELTISDIDVSKEHAEKLADLLVQSEDGRIMPLDTLAREVVKKLSKDEKIEGLNAVQIYLIMLILPNEFKKFEIIKTNNKEINRVLGKPLDRVLFAYNDFFGSDGSYKLAKYIEHAHKKKLYQRDEFEKEIVRLNELIKTLFITFNSDKLRIFPNPADKKDRWYSPKEAFGEFDLKSAHFIQAVLTSYFSNIYEALDSGDWSRADKALNLIKNYQQFYGASLIPANSRVKAEIFMNEYKPFKLLILIYALLGAVLFVVLIYNEFIKSKKLKWIISFLASSIFLAFFLHTTALVARWHISKHVPLSSAYETMLYIGWIVILVGLIFSRWTITVLAGASVLTAFTLYMANKSWLDSGIGTISSILDSHWLLLHVSFSAASYGFFGLGAFLSFVNLWLIIFKNYKNYLYLDNLMKKLISITEIGLILGVVLLIVGTFFGSIWASESWGRYWGWDPKESWTLITILVYVLILHLRLYKPFKSPLLFNALTLLAISTVFMAHFGVNYFFSSLHSYVEGNLAELPKFIYYIYFLIIVTISTAYLRSRKREKLK